MPEAEPELRVQTPVQAWWSRIWKEPERNGHWLTRFAILRLLGLIYLMAFLTWVNQGPALVGSHGLTPAAGYLGRWAAELGSRGAGFLQAPSIFWIADSDRVLF